MCVCVHAAWVYMRIYMRDLCANVILCVNVLCEEVYAHAQVCAGVIVYKCDMSVYRRVYVHV